MKIILGLAGEIASGKGTTAQYIIDKHNGSSHRFSTMLRDVARRMYIEETRESLQRLSTVFRENFGEETLSTVIAKDLESDPHEIIALDGARRLSDISHLHQLENFKLIFIEASPEVRYSRITSRGENADDAQKTFEEFQKDHDSEVELSIRELKDQADYIVDNNGRLEELCVQIDDIIKSLK